MLVKQANGFFYSFTDWTKFTGSVSGVLVIYDFVSSTKLDVSTWAKFGSNVTIERSGRAILL